MTESGRGFRDGGAFYPAAKQGKGRLYLLWVVGNSMIGAHIAAGELRVVEGEAPVDGEVVVALA